MKKLRLFSAVFYLSLFSHSFSEVINPKKFDVVCFDAHGCVLNKDWPIRIKQALRNVPRVPKFLLKTIAWFLRCQLEYQ